MNIINAAIFSIIDDLSNKSISINPETTRSTVLTETNQTTQPSNFAKTDPFYFTSVSLNNLRCFSKEIQLDFLHGEDQYAPWNIIIGDNGVGKTTVLRSLAMVLLFYKNANEWKKLVPPDYFFRNKGQKPKIGFGVMSKGAGLNEPEKYQFDITVSNNEFVPHGAFLSITDWVENLNVFAYGASRKIGSRGFTNETSFPAFNLFDENSPLTNAEEWLIKTDYLALKGGKAKQTLKKVKQLLIHLLGENVKAVEIWTEKDTPAVMFKTDYGWVGLHNLSMGHKTLIAWMVDFAKGLYDRYPDSDNPLAEPAILLIDEIDLHLHPKLQRGLMKFLTETFPHTQFIATAHSPLVVQSAEKSNIILLKKEGDHVIAVQNPIEVKSWRVDQLLTSDLYGLSSAHSPESEEVINRRRKLLKKDKRSAQEEKELESLEEELINMPIGETPEAIKAMEIIQKAAKNF